MTGAILAGNDRDRHAAWLGGFKVGERGGRGSQTPGYSLGEGSPASVFAFVLFLCSCGFVEHFEGWRSLRASKKWESEGVSPG